MNIAAGFLVLGLAFGASHADTVHETKAQIQKNLEDGLESLKAQVNELQTKIDHASGSVKKDMESQMENLEKDEKEVQAKLDKMKHSSGQAWEDVKAGTVSAYESFKKSVVQAKKRFAEEKSELKKESK